MDRVEALEKEVSELTSEELAKFRKWFAEFDADAWDKQIEADVEAGKFDEIIRKVSKEYDSGQTREL